MFDKHTMLTVRQAACDLVRITDAMSDLVSELNSNREVILRHLANIEHKGIRNRIESILFAAIPVEDVTSLHSECTMLFDQCAAVEFHNQSTMEMNLS